jgi:formylglycine-generating enzyme required for sulfatase activity
MKQNYKISLCALLLVGAVNAMTIGALGADKPKLAVFVVGMQTDALGNDLAQQIGAELNRNSRYEVLLSTNSAVVSKLTELRSQSVGSIDRNALAEWGRTNGVSTICLVTDAIKGNDNMFYALLIDAKDSKVNGRGSYIRTGVTTADLPRVSLALSRQLDGPGRRRNTPAPARSYPAELDIEMVFVEGGTFTMGCVPERDGTCTYLELPAHSVTVSSFYIGKYEVTQAQWITVMGGAVEGDDQRAICISRDSLKTFFEKLNLTTGKNYRLPTEAEWEYAARGGKMSQGYKYSGSNNPDEVGWARNVSSVQPVGRKKPNELGIYDMCGNVWEMCSGTLYTYTSTPVTNPTGGTGTSNYIRRGGSWNNDIHNATIVIRSFNLPANTAWGNTGIRVVLPAQ